MVYVPDAWVIIKLSGLEVESGNNGQPIYKVLAGWYGGYTGGDSWKLNSGITKIITHDRYYSVEGYSGSVYNCNMMSERMSGLMVSILNSLLEQAKDRDVLIEQVDISTILEKFK